jgi:hypothetical protein
MKKTTLFIFLAAIVVLSLDAQEKGPIAISPASDEGIARVGVSSPTFSWTAVEWATGYKVAVFESNGPNILSYHEMETISSPVLAKEIRGQALSWTPSSGERLNSEGMYVWYVQAVDGYGTGMWSEGRMFKVELEISLVGIEETVRESLRTKGMSEEVIDDVLEDMRLGMKDVVILGVDTEGDEAGTQDKIGIQGLEGTLNTFYGLDAGYTITDGGGTGIYNSFFGKEAGYFDSTGNNNTFMGFRAGYSTSDGDNNTLIGREAGYSISTGNNNTFMGFRTGFSTSTGNYNTFVGQRAGSSNSTGSSNTFLGYYAGYSNSAGVGNVFLGYNSGYNEIGSNRLYIDNSWTSSPLIWGNFSSDILTVHGQFAIGTKSPAYKMEMETTGENAAFVLDRTDGATNYINATASFGNFGTVSNHPLRLAVNSVWRMRLDSDDSLTMRSGATCTAGGKWVDSSSRKLKDNIRNLTVDEAMEALKGLEPIRFNYKADEEEECLGFIAEDVPDLVGSKDKNGMSAMDVVAVLTKVVQEQQKTIEGLKKRIDEFEGNQKQ